MSYSSNSMRRLTPTMIFFMIVIAFLGSMAAYIAVVWPSPRKQVKAMLETIPVAAQFVEENKEFLDCCCQGYFKYLFFRNLFWT